MANNNFSVMPRFTSSVRAKGRSASTMLSLPTSTVLDLECVKRKRARRKDDGKSVTELIKLSSAGCSSQDKQKVYCW